jgi:hypothetical protein
LDLPLFGKSVGIELPKVARANVSLEAAIRKRNINIKKLRVWSKKSEVTVTAKYESKRPRPFVTLGIKSDNFDLTEFFPELYSDESRPWIPPKDRPLNVFYNIPIFGKIVSMVDGDAEVFLGDFNIYRRLGLSDAAANIKIRDARAEVTASSGFMGGRARARAIADGDPDGTLHVRAAGTADNIAVGDILTSIYYPDYISGLPTDADFYVRGSGRDMSGLMSSMTGLARAASNGNGFAHEKLISVLYGRDFFTLVAESVEGVFTGRRRQMRMSCAVANLKVRNGRIDMDKNVVVQTRAVNVRAIGNIDLGRETMEVSLNTTPADGIKLSVSGNLVNSMEFVGNLAEPDIRLNRTAVAEKLMAVGVGIAVGALTGGVGLLVGAGAGLVGGEMISNWREDDNPCRVALKDGAPKSKSGDPAFMGQPVDRLAHGFLGD